MTEEKEKKINIKELASSKIIKSFHLYCEEDKQIYSSTLGINAILENGFLEEGECEKEILKQKKGGFRLICYEYFLKRKLYPVFNSLFGSKLFNLAHVQDAYKKKIQETDCKIKKSSGIPKEIKSTHKYNTKRLIIAYNIIRRYIKKYIKQKV